MPKSKKGRPPGRWPPLSSSTLSLRADREPVTAALEYRSRTERVDHAEVDVELLAGRRRREVTEQVLPAGSSIVAGDHLRNEPLAERQPVSLRARAVAVQRRVHPALEPVGVVRRQVAYPRFQVNDLLRVVRLTERDVTKAAAGGDVPKDHLDVEGRRLRPPRRPGFSAECEERRCQRGYAYRTTRE